MFHVSSYNTHYGRKKKPVKEGEPRDEATTYKGEPGDEATAYLKESPGTSLQPT